MPIIVVTCTSGGLAGRRFEFNKDRVTIGRRDTNDLVLAPNDTAASSDHCELRFQAGSWVVSDRASTNGTLVSGREIKAAVPVKTGLLVELGEDGPVLMVDIPDVPDADDPVGLANSKPVTIAQRRAPSFNQQETFVGGDDDVKEPVAGVHAAVSPRVASPTPIAAPLASPSPDSGEGPSTGRTAFYMALMTDKVQKSSSRLKVMIALLGLLLVGVVAFAVVMALRVQEGEDRRAVLEEDLKNTGERLDETSSALNETKQALGKAETRMANARLKLATTSGKIADLRLAIDTAKGDAKTKLEAQAKALEATRLTYETRLKVQGEALAKLNNRRVGGERIAKENDQALYMLIAPTASGGESGFCTAFAIHASGILATNSHCLRTMEGLKLEGKSAVARMNRSTGKSFTVTRWRGHPKHTKLLSEDVALVWLDTKGQQLPRVVTLAPTDKMKHQLAPGRPVYTMGYPGKVMNEANPAADFRAAVISRLTDFDNRPGTNSTARVVWHSALTSKGTSGSPIFNADGEVIAVNTGGLSARTVEVTDKQTNKTSEQTVYDATGLNFGVRVDALREIFAPDVVIPAAPKAVVPGAAKPTP